MIKLRWREAVVLSLVFILYLSTLFWTSVPFTGDQKVYLSIAAEMREKGEWLIPYLFDRVNFLKPPFQYWMTLAGWSVFGFNSFGAFFPSVLALLGCAILVNSLGPKKDALGAVFFCATLGALTYGTTAQMEVWVTLFYLLAWFYFLREKFYLAFLVVGVMSWIKGPLYPVIWAISALFYVGLRKRFERFKSGRIWIALGIGVAVGLSWYVVAYSLYPNEVSEIFFKRENFQKIQTPQGSMLGLWGDFLFSLFPALSWMLMSFNREHWKQRWIDHKYFFLAFGLIFFLFFSLFPYHVGAYLFPLTPLVIWMFVNDETPPKNTWVSFIQCLVLAIGVALQIIWIRFFLGDWVPFPIFVLFTIGLIAWVGAHFFRNAWGVASSSLVLVILVRLSAISLGEADIADLAHYVQQNPTQKIAYWVESEDIWHEWGWISVALQRPLKRLKSEEEIEYFLEEGGALILSDEQQERGTSLKCVDWMRMKRRIKFPLKEMLISGLKRTDSSVLRTFRICSRRQ